MSDYKTTLAKFDYIPDYFVVCTTDNCQTSAVINYNQATNETDRYKNLPQRLLVSDSCQDEAVFGWHKLH